MNVTFRRNSSKEGNRIQLKKWLTLAFLFIGPACYAQSATINWTSQHQTIDGFGAADANDNGTNQELTSSQFSFFFGTGSGQLGFSIMRVHLPGNNGTGPADVGNCATVNAGCVGSLPTDYTSAVSAGVRIVATPWEPPFAYTNNTSTGGVLVSAHYQDYADWLTNYALSWKQYQGVYPFAISVQNEPEFSTNNMSAQQYHDFITSNLGPTFTTNSIPSIILLPETSYYSHLVTHGATCATDPTCMAFNVGVDVHDYDATVTGTDVVNVDTYPSGWIATPHYLETEASCPGIQNYCEAGDVFPTDIAYGLDWAAVIDQRMAVDNYNAWMWWWMLIPNSGATGEGEGLMTSGSGLVSPVAWVMGQYARFIRPGYVRIDATHKPQTGVSVSAYQNTSGGNLTIVATNYTASPIVQLFNITNAPNFTSVTPYITSATQNIQAQSAQSVSGNSFTYTLPADSVTTFVGASSSSTVPAPPSNLRSVVN